MLTFTLLFACRPNCPDGQSFTASGECVDTPSGSESVDGAEDLPACEERAEGTRLDIVYGCADGVCARDGYDTFVETLGQPDDCADLDEALLCRWMDETLWATFDDEDFDEVPDEGTVAEIVHVDAPWDGTDEYGLGPGVSGTCFLDTFGVPEEVDYDETTEGESRIDVLYWSSVDAFAYLDEDGLVETISMLGLH